MILDVAPHIRQILRVEHERKNDHRKQSFQGNLWNNRCKTRGQRKAEREGRTKYFRDKVDAELILKTWIEDEIPEDGKFTEVMQVDDQP